MTKFIAMALALAASPAFAGNLDAAALPRQGAVAQLRAQNAALQDKMGRLQLDLLIANVIARDAPRAGLPRQRTGGIATQVVAFRK